MSKIKRAIIIVAIILIAMLIIPLITVNTVKADAGMLVTMMLFFVVHPIVSIATGILAGKDIKFFWPTPILVAGLFWAFSSFTYVVMEHRLCTVHFSNLGTAAKVFVYGFTIFF